MKKTILLLLLISPAAHAVTDCVISPAPATVATGSVQTLKCDPENNLYITGGRSSTPTPTTGAASSEVDRSGTVAAGGTFQTAAASASGRLSIHFQNICNVTGKCTAQTNFCYVNVNDAVSATTSNSLAIAPGQAYLRSDGAIPSNAIRVTCDGTGDKFYLTTQ